MIKNNQLELKFEIHIIPNLGNPSLQKSNYCISAFTTNTVQKSVLNSIKTKYTLKNLWHFAPYKTQNFVEFLCTMDFYFMYNLKLILINYRKSDIFHIRRKNVCWFFIFLFVCVYVCPLCKWSIILSTCSIYFNIWIFQRFMVTD